MTRKNSHCIVFCLKVFYASSVTPSLPCCSSSRKRKKTILSLILYLLEEVFRHLPDSNFSFVLPISLPPFYYNQFFFALFLLHLNISFFAITIGGEKMAALQVPVTSGINCINRYGNFNFLMGKELRVRGFFSHSGLTALSGANNNCTRGCVRVGCAFKQRRFSRGRIWCSLGSTDDNGDRIGENFDENGGGEYVNSTVMEAVEVKNGSDAFLIKMRDGRYLKCVYNHPRVYPPDYLSHPAIVLKMEEASGLVLPIIVLEMPSILLMAALRNIEMSRPTVYQTIKEMIERMGYMVKVARVTRRVQEAYFAELCLVKVGDESVCVTIDLRPSDAINIAVRCKAPIQVSKKLAYDDGLKIVESTNLPLRNPLSNVLSSSELDRPDGQPCPESEEFILLRNMLIAAIEERYHDAAQWKDLLNQFRTRRQKWT